MHDFEQSFNRLRQRSIAIPCFLMEQSEITDGLTGRQPFVQRQALMAVLNVVVRNKSRDGNVQSRINLFFHPLTFHLMDRFFNHLHIQVHADRGNVAGLLFA